MSRPRTGLALAGGITLGASWFVNAAFMTTIFRTPEAMVSLVPLVGPIIWSVQHVHEWAGSLYLLWGVVSAAPQIAGLAMLIAGLSPRQEWVLVGDPTNPALTIGVTPGGIGGRF